LRLVSWSKLAELMRDADVVLEVLDARVPLETRSIRVEGLARRRGKPVVIVLNKCDLVPRRVVEGWVRFFEGLGFKTVAMAARSRRGVRRLKEVIRESVSKKPIIVVAVGLPKTGKSTVINALKGRSSASTSPYPGTAGYTKSVQLYRVDDDIKVIDTPGITPSGEDWLETLIRGRPVDSLYNPIRPAVELLKRILGHNPKAVEDAYGITDRDPYVILERLALKRGWRYKDGEPLIEEAARTVIRDYHNAKLRFYRTPPSSTPG